MSQNAPMIIEQGKIDEKGRIAIGIQIIRAMKLKPGDVLEKRYVRAHAGSGKPVVILQKAEN